MPVIARAGLVSALALAALATPACYTGSAYTVPASTAAALARDPAWQIVPDVPFVAQQAARDCGPAALAMVLAHFRVTPETPLPPELAGGDVRAGALRDAARSRGLDAYVVEGTLGDLFTQVGRGRPVIVGLAKPMALTGGRALAHYEVIVGVNRSQRLILSLDPAMGLRENTLEGFAREWAPTKQVTIVFLGPRAGSG
ncbi:MAG TPA: cysteine peptidase family C39 domain-containing protein [Polyangia bacterium]|nr:cysteine peptidase family C39 domain-containing protein [Polyangia bacterium]